MSAALSHQCPKQPAPIPSNYKTFYNSYCMKSFLKTIISAQGDRLPTLPGSIHSTRTDITPSHARGSRYIWMGDQGCWRPS